MGASCCTSRDDREGCGGSPCINSRAYQQQSSSLNAVISRFAVASSGRLEELYELHGEVGEGAFGSVRTATKKGTHAHRAVKTMSKSNSARDEDLEQVRKEVAIMGSLDHPHIIRLYETFEDARHYHLVMELCGGGELFDRIVEAGHFTEVQAAHVMEQIMHGINYMHTSFVCHRDMKAENVLCLGKDPMEDNTIKIIDFGLASHFKHGEPLKTRAGTPTYLAPEVIKGHYNELCDVWSCGALLYILLSGAPPFYGSCDAQVFRRITKGEYNFPADTWDGISQDARDLIGCMLTSAKTRSTAEDTLAHAWTAHKAPAAHGGALSGGLIGNLMQFQRANKFKKAALQIIANQLDDANSNSLREAFEELDKNGDGLLTLVELRAGLQNAGLTEIPPNLQDIISSIDADGSGVIDYTEFLSAALTKEQYQNQDALMSAFKTFDRDGNGTISKKELAAALGRQVTPVDISARRLKDDTESMFEQIDKNGDGEIDFEEFKAMMCAGPDGQ